MKLPLDYLDLVRSSARTLYSIGTRARNDATHTPTRPELWLAVRDLEGLAERLAGLDDLSWREAPGTQDVTGQDLGVLDELLHARTPPLAITEDERRSLTLLRDFLGRYIDGEYELEEWRSVT